MFIISLMRKPEMTARRQLMIILSAAVCSLFGVCPWNVSAERPVPRVKMLVPDQTLGLDPGQRLELSCEFYMEHFDLFENPVLWKKVQNDEVTPININGNILEPFVETGRFEVRLIQNIPTHRIILIITAVRLEDSGNYTCEVRGRDSSVLAAVNNVVYVRAPVQTVHLGDTNLTALSPDDPVVTIHRDPSLTLEYTESIPATVYCVSYGGCPPPDLAVYIDKRDISKQFAVHTSSWLSGTYGLRFITYRTEIWSNDFAATAEADDKLLQCIASVGGLEPSVASARLMVKYAPVILCDDTSARLGDSHVTLRCEVKARPGLLALFWTSSTNGTVVTSGDVTSEYRTQNMDRGNGVIETRLHIGRVVRDSFRPYTIVAENVIGRTTHQTGLASRSKSSSHQSKLQILEPDQPHNIPAYHPSYSSASAGTSSSSTVVLLVFLRVLTESLHDR